MRRVLVNTFLTLDGVMQAPGGPEEDGSGDFAHGGWTVPFWDDVVDEVMDRAFGVPFDLLLGRRTYEIFAGFWPTAPEEIGSKPLNDATKYVASRGDPSLDWGPAVLIEGDAADGVAELKKSDGPELQVHGSGNLLQALMRRGLVDVYRLFFFPVVIGSGKRLFADGAVPATLRLVDHQVSTTGVQIGTYEPTGELVTGTFHPD
jgi:dihydrofolate reductase